ncbi:hypothetical protein B0E53_01506 [Micromonospora sp. MH33]|uniref:right-handed parallel beta-helix repeat-containing protein n=1 Tax=Micromonospora sp. MH33 TaxID=1945509 RepID=UPI000D14A047|nr:right-handed parallel beta-helix repeat-containing protein [Micromonospora sp. MH33]PSK66490.1 hypothetical protein B0E53_01506 [Micromonospora sp. MH33]
MRNSSVAGLTALALTGGSLLTFATPARAADATVLYVRQTSTACSDTGPGTAAQPFCSISAAAALASAGQTVDVSGTYRERVTIGASGTPEAPIVFRSSANTIAVLTGPTAGFTIDGQHDITIRNLKVIGATDLPALDVRNASDITVEGGGFSMADNTAITAVRFSGVHRSSITRSFVSARPLAAGVLLDGTTSGVRLESMSITDAPAATPVDQSAGIRIEGPDNTVVNNVVRGFTGAAIAVQPGASGTTVVNNEINGGAGHGIHNHGASGTAITNNTVRDRCLDGIRVDGDSTAVSVQNNLLVMNGPFGQTDCTSPGGPGVEIAVQDGAVTDTLVDYNNANHYNPGSSTIYAWNGSRMSLAAFQAASRQATHDLDTPGPRAGYDSANSAAPGFSMTDRVGTARIDDPAVANTGVGPLPYADRGALETIRSPQARMTVKLDLDTGTVTVDASTSEPGVAPIASYRFSFGDGTAATQDTPVITHRYTTRGDYTVSVDVAGTDGRMNSTGQMVSVLPRTGTIGLLTLSALRYVAPMAAVPWPSLGADRSTLDAGGQFDLVDAGGGQVALFARASGQYVAADAAGEAAVSYQGQAVLTNHRFTLTRNADGTISLRSQSSGRFVTATPNASTPLIANGQSIGIEQKFYRVNVTDAGRSFKAGANGKYVTAENAGAKPLIATRTAVGPWERFDLVDLGNGQIGVFAHANNRFVCADNSGVNPLIANRLSAGAWEKFTLVRNTDGTVSLKAAVNSRYVTADSGGAKPLIANRTAIGPWEKFTLGS